MASPASPPLRSSSPSTPRQPVQALVVGVTVQTDRMREMEEIIGRMRLQIARLQTDLHYAQCMRSLDKEESDNTIRVLSSQIHALRHMVCRLIHH